MRTCAWTPDKFQYPACALREFHRNTLLSNYPSSNANPKVAEHNMGRRCSSELSATYADIGDLAGPYADIGDLAGPPRRHRRPCRTLPARSLNFAT